MFAKATLSSILLLVFQHAVLAQGQLIFNNRVNNVVLAPVYGPDPGDPSLVLHGNSTNGFPTGTQTYEGMLLSGSAFMAQLFGGAAHAPVSILQPLSPTAPFRTGEAAGFVVPPSFSVPVPGVEEGEPARIVLRAWDNRGGAITNWLQALADPSIPRGQSLSILTPPLGSLFQPPPNLIGLQSFNLAVSALQPVQPTRINFQPPGAAPLGYLTDRGSVFGPRSAGLEYGWTVDLEAAARQRNSARSPDPRRDTFVEMAGPARWELAVSNGLYAVHVAVGDPETIEGVYRVDVEGALAVQGAQAINQHWVDGSALVFVEDGRLTIASGIGSSSNPLCFVDVARIATPILNPLPPEDGRFRFSINGEAGLIHVVEGATALNGWEVLGISRETAPGLFFFQEPEPVSQRFFRARVEVSIP